MLNTKLVFLDIDGVLNSRRSTYAFSSTHRLDPVAMSLLNELLRITGADVVISSTWRLGRTLDQLFATLTHEGFAGNIIGKTPHLGDFRGQEIDQWLETYKWDHNDPDYKYVIFDDDRDFRLGQPLIWVDNKYGLTHAHVHRAAHTLGLLSEYHDYPLLSITEIMNDH